MILEQPKRDIEPESRARDAC